MPIATSDQYAAMLDAAARGGHALAAVNVTSSGTLNGVLRGLAEAQADGIVQITTGAAAFLSGPARDMAAGGRAFAYYAHAVAERSPVLIALHTDHAPPDSFDAFVRPLIEESRRRDGRPLFNSHMFDGSSLLLGQNLDRARRLLDELAPLGVVLEVETGVVGGEEDGVRGPGDPGNPALYTTVADLEQVAAVLGTGERGRYLLAATFGNVHGVYGPGQVELRPQILADGQAAVAPARFQYVFHGSSGSTQKELAQAIANGVVKVNVDTDAQYAFTRAVADHLFTNYDGVLKTDGGVGRKAAYDPRSWGGRAEAALAQRVAEIAESLGSAGRSLLR